MTVVAIIIEGNKTSARSKVKKCEAIEKIVEYSKKLGFKINIKLSAIDMRYLGRSKFSRSLVEKESFGLI